MSGTYGIVSAGIQEPMRSLLLAALLLPQTSTPLVRFRDTARPVLIFAPSTADPRFLTELRELEPHTSGLAERQVVVLVFAGQGNWPRPADGTVWPASTPDAARTRQVYRIAPQDFSVVLVGKDGGEKQRWHQPVPYDTIRGLIDAMPMRRQEMRGLAPR